MPKIIPGIALLVLLCANPVRSADSPQSPASYAIHPAHGENADDHAYRLRQRRHLADLMAGLTLVAVIYLVRKSAKFTDAPPN